MSYVRANISYQDFITGRDVDNAVGFADKPGSAGLVESVRPGDTEITEAEYLALQVEILAWNAMIPAPPPPILSPDELALQAALQDITVPLWAKALIRRVH